MRFIPCNTTQDCFQASPIPRVCYKNAVFSTETNFCDCSTWFGWIGENCDQPSPALIYNRCFYVVILVWSSTLCLLLLRTLVMTLVIEGVRRKVISDYIFLTGVASLGAVLSTTIVILTKTLSFFDPSRFELNQERSRFFESNLEVLFVGYSTFVAFAVAALCCQSLAFIFFVLRWEQILFKSNPFVSMFEAKTFKGHMRVCKVLFFIGINFLTSLFMAERYTDVFVACGIVSVALAISVFSLGYRSLGYLYHFMEEEKNDVVRESVRMSAWMFKVGTVCIIILAFVIAIVQLTLSFDENEIVPGKLNFAGTLIDLQILALLIFFSVVSWYINSICTGAILADFYPNLCCFFRVWDKRNKKIFPEEHSIQLTQLYSTK